MKLCCFQVRFIDNADSGYTITYKLYNRIFFAIAVASLMLCMEISQCFLQSLFRHLSCRNRNADLKVLTLITHINGKFKVTSVCRNTFFIQKTGSLLYHVIKLLIDVI